MSAAICKAFVAVIEDPADVRVGDDVYLYTAGRTTCYGRVIGLTVDPDRPFTFDQGFVPVLGDGGDDWRFAFAIRVVDMSLHPAGGAR